MEKNKENTLFPSFKSNYKIKNPSGKFNFNIITNTSGKSNDPFSSYANSNINTIENRHNKDIEEIGRMQRLGVLRKITKKDSENMRKNNFKYEKDLSQVLMK